MKTILTMYVTLMPVILTGIFNMIFCKSSFLKALNIPMDCNKVLKDGKRLFGNHKTWKGFLGYLVIGIVVTIFWGWICFTFSFDNYFYYSHKNTFFYNSLLGFLLGLTYAFCELPNSFLKRRFDIQEGKSSFHASRVLFFFYDQIDSIIGCCVIVCIFYPMSISKFFLYVLLGGVTHVIINVLLYVLKIRKNMF